MAAAGRIVLAAGLMARLGIEYGLDAANRPGLLLTAVYLLFSIAYAWIEKWHRGAGRYVAFGLDGAAFVVSALLAPSAWQVQLQYAFVLVTVLLFHDWPLFGASYALVVAAPARLVPALAALMLLSAMAMLIRAVLEERLFQSSRQSVYHRAGALHARDAERERLADDFHDGPLQVFTGFQLRLSVLKRLIERGEYEKALREIGELLELWQTEVTQVRTFVSEVRSAETHKLDAVVAVRRLAEEFQKSTGIQVRLNAEDLGDHNGTALVGIVLMVGEALQNVRKHARATEVSVTVTRAESGIAAAIEDNGRGFPFGGTYTLDDLESMGAGPMSIRRRVRELGGELSVESRPGHGSALRIRVPV
jgi:signal transduction histidine kinase